MSKEGVKNRERLASRDANERRKKMLLVDRADIEARLVDYNKQAVILKKEARELLEQRDRIDEELAAIK